MQCTPPSQTNSDIHTLDLQNMESFFQFVCVLITTILFGSLSIVLVLTWVYEWRQGLAWDGGSAEFNWHPVLLTIGFIVIHGLALIVYRLPWTWKFSKLYMKYIHASLNLVAFVLVVISLVAVYDFHNAKMIPNLYSLHSWIGLAAVILYALQIVMGLCIFLLPVTPAWIRGIYLPIHVFAGLFIFGMVIVAAEMGITEKLIFTLRSKSNTTRSYSQSPPEAILANTLGVFILIFGGGVMWIATRPEWKRPPEHVSMAVPATGNKGNEAQCILKETRANAEAGIDQEAEGAVRNRNLSLEEPGQRSTF